MRLTSPLSEIKGVGPRTFAAFEAAGFCTAEDMIRLLPRRYDDYSEVVNIADLQPGNVAVRAIVESVHTKRVRRNMAVTTAVLTDTSGKVKAVWFNQPYRETQLRTGKTFLFSGNFGMKFNSYQITSPSVEVVEGEAETASSSNVLVPVYRQIKNITPKLVRQTLEHLKPLIEFIPETLPKQIATHEGLISHAKALQALHFPSTPDDIAHGRERLAFEELFEMLLAAEMNKRENMKLEGWHIPFDQPTVKAFVDSLPFPLTNAQRRAAWQILQDFEKAIPMNRLLQGDVGSGKTVVAGLVARQAAQAGLQTAIMAPTEILASQHAKTLADLLEPHGVSVALLTGSVKGAARQELLKALEGGAIDIVIGTHALIQESVHFHKLGLVVIDEQHRFGVKQRQVLMEKSQHMPHLLSMTATPIPRSLALTLYGELDVSILDELPAGRQPISTKIWSPASTPSMYALVDKEIASGRQVYVICPLIDDSATSDKKSVEAEYRRLRNSAFGARRIGLLHGKMKPQEKDEVMQQFSSGALDILVSTTVVEVGVNVPNATVMIIENADQFGLSQLHQLRGRVGRGEHKSYCHLVLSTHDKPSQRLREIEKSQDGFHLAEVDLELRGPGEVYGRAQHGALNLQIATLADTKLIARAKHAAIRLIDSREDISDYKHLNGAVARYQRLTTLN